MITDDVANDVMNEIYDAVNRIVSDTDEEEGEVLILMAASNLLASIIGMRIQKGDLDGAKQMEDCCYASVKLAISKVKN